MIRFFVLVGLVGGLLVAYLTTLAVGPETQLPPPQSLLTKFRAEGYLPENLNLGEDEELEHGIFELPPMDEVMLEAALEAQGDMMAGMDMSGSSGGSMDMSSGEGGTMNMSESDSGTMNMAEGETMDMDMDGDGKPDMKASDMTDGGTMNMAEGGSMDMDMDGDGKPDMKASDMTDGGTMNMAEGESMDMDMDGDGKPDMKASDMTEGGTMTMAEGESMELDTDGDAEPAMKMDGDGDAMAMDMGEGGLLVTEEGDYDRVIDLTMAEWKFSDMSIDVKMGERIRFNVKNDGQIPHEFMFMTMPLMNAVDYRATRADWNLFEHEALFEKSLVLPGGDFSFVVTVTEPGTWMFMCMLPYHMQMGMMGQMSTPGMAMDMQM